MRTSLIAGFAVALAVLMAGFLNLTINTPLSSNPPIPLQTYFPQPAITPFPSFTSTPSPADSNPFQNSLITQSPSPALVPDTNPTPTLSSPFPTPPPSPSHFYAEYSTGELVYYVLELINSDRQYNGLQNVTLSRVISAQNHATDMLQKGYFSHWNTDGYKPHMRYTLAGGTGAVNENIAGMYSTGTVNVKDALRSLEYKMMYDDASANWGHRNNILTTAHNKVAIGVTYDRSNVYLVEDFENDHISWANLSITKSTIDFAGTIHQPELTIQSINIYYDNPTNLTPRQLKDAPYNGSYSMGTFVGIVLPPNWLSNSGVTITANVWHQTSQRFHINFDLIPAFESYGKGTYTLVLETNQTSTATSNNSLMTYSIWHTG